MPAQIDPFHAIAIGALAHKLADAGRSIIHMEFGQPSTGAPAAAIAAAHRVLDADPMGYWENPGLKARIARMYAEQHGVDIAQLALQFSVANPDLTTCVTGSANPKRIAQWVQWIQQPIDQSLLQDVLQILKPVHNWFYIEGRPENNDTPEKAEM